MENTEIKKLAIRSIVSEAASEDIGKAYQLITDNARISADVLLTEIEKRDLDESTLDHVICILQHKTYVERYECPGASILAHRVNRMNPKTGKTERTWTTNGRSVEWKEGTPDHIYALFFKLLTKKSVDCIKAQVIDGDGKPTRMVEQKDTMLKTSLTNLIADGKVTLSTVIDKELAKKEAEAFMKEEPNFRRHMESWLNESVKDIHRNPTGKTRRERFIKNKENGRTFYAKQTTK